MTEMGATLPASGQEGPLASPSDKGNTSTVVSNSTLPWCYVVNVNGTDSTNSISSPPGVSLTNASLPQARFGHTKGTNTRTVLFNSTTLCAEPLVISSASRTPTSGFSPRANLQALDISVTTNTSVVSITSSSHPISPSSSGVSSTPVSTTTPSESSSTVSGVPTSPSVVSPLTPAVSSSATITVSNGPSSVTPSPPASVTTSSTQGIPTSTLTETPESTVSTPVSITQTTDNYATITTPPLVITTGLSTLPSKSVTVTSVIANSPNQDVSGSSKGDSFFKNHAAVIGVFLASGFTFAGLVLLAFCCLRRRQRRARWRGSQLLESPHPRPIRNPFANVTGNPTTSERAGPNIRWYRSMLPRDPASMPQSLFSVPLNHSEDNLVPAHSAPVPPSSAQRVPSRSSYRVPVPYAGIGVHDDDTWVENRRSTGSASEHLQIQSTPSSNGNGPPLLPVRSPLRPLEVHNITRIPPREKTLSLSLSRASSPSVYPPSPHRSDAGSFYQEEFVANLPPKQESPRWLTRGLSYGIKPGEGRNVDRVDENAESRGAQINSDDSRGALSLNVSVSSSSNVHHSPLESPVSETGTALTSIQDVNSPNRKVALPLAPPAPLFMHRN